MAIRAVRSRKCKREPSYMICLRIQVTNSAIANISKNKKRTRMKKAESTTQRQKSSKMDESPEEIISRELNTSEQLLWAGRPPLGLMFRTVEVFLIPFSVLWGGFAIFWTAAGAHHRRRAFRSIWVSVPLDRFVHHDRAILGGCSSTSSNVLRRHIRTSRNRVRVVEPQDQIAGYRHAHRHIAVRAIRRPRDDYLRISPADVLVVLRGWLANFRSWVFCPMF